MEGGGDRLSRGFVFVRESDVHLTLFENDVQVGKEYYKKVNYDWKNMNTSDTKMDDLIGFNGYSHHLMSYMYIKDACTRVLNPDEDTFARTVTYHRYQLHEKLFDGSGNLLHMVYKKDAIFEEFYVQDFKGTNLLVMKSKEKELRKRLRKELAKNKTMVQPQYFKRLSIDSLPSPQLTDESAPTLLNMKNIVAETLLLNTRLLSYKEVFGVRDSTAATKLECSVAVEKATKSESGATVSPSTTSVHGTSKTIAPSPDPELLQDTPRLRRKFKSKDSNKTAR